MSRVLCHSCVVMKMGLTIGLVWRFGVIFLKDIEAFGLLAMDFHISFFPFFSQNEVSQPLAGNCLRDNKSKIRLAQGTAFADFLRTFAFGSPFDEPGWRKKADKLK